MVARYAVVSLCKQMKTDLRKMSRAKYLFQAFLEREQLIRYEIEVGQKLVRKL